MAEQATLAQAMRDLWPVFQAILEALVEQRMALEQARLRQPGVGPVSGTGGIGLDSAGFSGGSGVEPMGGGAGLSETGGLKLAVG